MYGSLSVVPKHTTRATIWTTSMCCIVKAEPRRSMVEDPRISFFARDADKIRSIFSKKPPPEKSDHLRNYKLYFKSV